MIRKRSMPEIPDVLPVYKNYMEDDYELAKAKTRKGIATAEAYEAQERIWDDFYWPTIDVTPEY